MLEIIIALLISLGINLDSDNVTVIDDATGITFGVGSGSTSSQRPNESEEPVVYVLIQDANGEYHLERR